MTKKVIKKLPKMPKFIVMIDIKGYVEVELQAADLKCAINKAENICMTEYFKPKSKCTGHLEKQKVTGIWCEV